MDLNEKFLNEINGIFYQVDTYSEYDIEKEYSPKLFRTSSVLQEIGVKYILKSMTENQKFILKEIAKYQLENPNELGITYSSLFNEVEEIGIASPSQLHAYLKEAKDHKLVKEVKGENHITYLAINHPSSILHELIFMIEQPETDP